LHGGDALARCRRRTRHTPEGSPQRRCLRARASRGRGRHRGRREVPLSPRFRPRVDRSLGARDREHAARSRRGDADRDAWRAERRASAPHRLPSRDEPVRNQRGFALLAVMLVLALLGVVVTELSVSMRLEASMVRSYKESVQATHLAEAAVQQAMREILGPGNIQALDRDGARYTRARRDGLASPISSPKLPREGVALGAGEFSY